ncbi:MAG: hypothetical protein FVQ77_14655 [Cytophagales bacterium]|nr:hypothetical protein [Cytophagales bacterium]
MFQKFPNILFLLVFVFSTVTALNVVIKSFTASYQGVDIRLDWEINDNMGVGSFDLYRKIDDKPEKKIITINSTGSLDYFFIDDNIYKNSDNPQTLVYRLITRSSEGDEISITSIQHDPTAVQRSWGSIKSMFK